MIHKLCTLQFAQYSVRTTKIKPLSMTGIKTWNVHKPQIEKKKQKNLLADTIFYSFVYNSKLWPYFVWSHIPFHYRRFQFNCCPLSIVHNTSINYFLWHFSISTYFVCYGCDDHGCFDRIFFSSHNSCRGGEI